MKHADYWAERMTLLQEKLLQKADALLPEIEKAYRRAGLHIQREIEVFYQRYAAEEGLTLAQAKEKLTAAEKSDFLLTLEEYIEAGERNHADPEWIEKLRATSTYVRITRLEALEMQMQQQIELLEAQKADALTKTLADILTEAYYRTGYEVQKGIGIGAAFATLDTEKIKSILAQPWHEDGLNFSERIWGKDRKKLVQELKTTFTDAIIRGESPQKTIDLVQKHLHTSRSNAGGLVLTEGAAFAARGRQEAYDRLGTERYQFLATLGGTTCERCGAMDGKVFKREDYKIGKTAPPLHPHCRCTTVPYFKDEFTKDEQRAARDAEGKGYEVPAEMTFAEWKKAFVDGDASGLTVATGSSIIQLTNEEKRALNEYISSGSYKLNALLREGAPLEDEQIEFVRLLDGVLSKMSNYEGTVYRSISDFGIDDVDAFWAKYVPGEKISFPAYTSAGTEVYDESLPIQYTIQSKKGKDIRDFNQKEFEIVFSRNTEFRVVKIERNRIYMEEL